MQRTGSATWRRALAALALVAVAGCSAARDGAAGSAATTAPAASTPATRSGPPATTGTTSATSATSTTSEPAAGAAPRAGAATDPDGIGDELFPELGNPGIDVQHYDVDLTYDHQAKTIAGSVGLDVRMTEDRGAFTLDSSGPVVDAVTVDGVPAAFAHDGVELRITPAVPLLAGDTHRLDVTYHAAVDSVDSATGIPVGWFNTADGSYVLNEPDGARSWLPSNDHPSDKATFDFTIHVAPGVTGVANGKLVGHTTTAGGETWRWRQDEPMATYLIQLLTGDYELVEATGPGGLPLVSAILRSELPEAQPYLDEIDDQIAFFETVFGAYPLDRYGIAVTDSFPGLAMETQGRAQFSKDDLGGGGFGDSVFAHELAHQWFGDAVTPARWQDIWLNEGFATYAERLWMDHVDGGTGQVGGGRGTTGGSFRHPVAEPTPVDMFGSTTYQGGATVLAALRAHIGDEQFFDLLRRWVADNDGRSRTTADFIALAEEVSGTDQTEFFDDWLFADRFPATGGVPDSVPELTTTTGS